LPVVAYRSLATFAGRPLKVVGSLGGSGNSLRARTWHDNVGVRFIRRLWVEYVCGDVRAGVPVGMLIHGPQYPMFVVAYCAVIGRS